MNRFAGEGRPREIALDVCVEGLVIIAWLRGRLPRSRDGQLAIPRRFPVHGSGTTLARHNCAISGVTGYVSKALCSDARSAVSV